jgi:hypothetical protein
VIRCAYCHGEILTVDEAVTNLMTETKDGGLVGMETWCVDCIQSVFEIDPTTGKTVVVEE